MNTVQPFYLGLGQGTRTYVTEVIFNPPLTPSQLSYARLCARTNFYQLVLMAKYMNEGMTFEEAVVKYLRKYEKPVVKQHEYKEFYGF